MWHSFVIACISGHLISKTEFVTWWKIDKEKKIIRSIHGIVSMQMEIEQIWSLQKENKGKGDII